ncbi:hypothetical protein ACMSE1_01990 [Bacteroides thetaiotaomicron]|jgi:hypothetical protein|uniref:hypothetical protein n=1 Tax=Bacteroides TaxID=816 RepID=UPI000FE1B43C|nr:MULTISPECIES: hypothetical protein [Bacteroides]CAG9924444.1 hypothetical protein BOVAB4_4719 [Bacteroides ovatus]
MSKITMIDNAESALAKICEGNPGAINACCCIIKEGAKVYPYVDGWEYIILLDKLEIYGSDIYVLWNDICQRGTRKMIAALRIAKIDPAKADVLKDACHRQDYSGRKLLQEDDIYKKIIE